MKKINNIIIALASLFVMASCSNDFSVAEQPSFTFESNIVLENGDEVGYFSIDNNNIPFTAVSSSQNTIFSGKLGINVEGEYSYVVYPYNKGVSPDQNRTYTFTLPSEQILKCYEGLRGYTDYAYMIGYSATTKSSSSYEFEPLMAKMDIVVANNSGVQQKIKRITMSEGNGKAIFPMSATIEMNPTKVDIDTYEVSVPTESSLSVKIANPEYVQNEKSEVISLMFFPTEIEHASELIFTIETENESYRIVKTIAGLGKLNFKRGERYITPLSIE